MKFGEILRMARERNGIDLTSAARQLRIRPDILRAIESNDFSRMPPRGYARNMINAYARLLGLNPTEITRLYLDEAYAYEVGLARNDDRPSHINASRSGRNPRRQERAETPSSPEGRTSALGRRTYTDADPEPRIETRRSSGRASAPANPSSGSRSARSPRSNSDRTHRTRQTALPNAHYTNFYAAPSNIRPQRSKAPFIIAGVVVLVVLVVVCVLAFGNKPSSKDDVPTIPVTGLTDPEANGSDSTTTQQETSKKTPVAPTSLTVEFQVLEGQQAWIEVYLDGATSPSEAGTFSAGDKKSFDVTGTLTITTANPSGVKVTQDGKEVTLTDEKGIGVYSYTVDFAKYLDQWRADNGITTSTDGSSNSTGTAGSGSNTTGTTTNGTAPSNENGSSGN